MNPHSLQLLVRSPQLSAFTNFEEQTKNLTGLSKKLKSQIQQGMRTSLQLQEDQLGQHAHNFRLQASRPIAVQILTSGHDTGTIEVCYAEETLADLWAKSAAALEEFPDHPETVRRAV